MKTIGGVRGWSGRGALPKRDGCAIAIARLSVRAELARRRETDEPLPSPGSAVPAIQAYRHAAATSLEARLDSAAPPRASLRRAAGCGIRKGLREFPYPGENGASAGQCDGSLEDHRIEPELVELVEFHPMTPTAAVTRTPRIFLLSPADCAGKRARMVLSNRARFDLARRLRTPEGAPLGEVFSFMSGLYFRGKLAYARAFSHPPEGMTGIFVITPSRGLRPADERVTVERLRGFSRVPIDEERPGYRRPLLRDARGLAERVGAECEIVLLGSVATGKYVEPLQEVLGERLRFPAEFVGRGDMSRGGLMLRCVDAGTELLYVPLAGASRHGPRPPKLSPRRFLMP